MLRNYRLNNIFLPLGFYWQTVLDVILTHVCVLALLKTGFPKAAASFMSLDSLLKIVFSFFLMNYISRIPYSKRKLISISMKLMIACIWAISISIASNINLFMLTCSLFILFKLILHIDLMLCSDFIFHTHKQFKIDLAQSAAVQNILLRASTAIAPLAALAILSMPNVRVIVCLASLSLTILIVTLLRKAFRSAPSFSDKTSSQQLPLAKLMDIPMAKWGLLFQLLFNLSFAGVSFLLLSELTSTSHWFFNGISMLYGAFFIAQLAVIAYGNKIIPVNNTSQMSIAMTLCGLGVLFTGFATTENATLISCVALGFAYSLCLSATPKVVTEKLQNDIYIGYLSWAQIASRGSSLIITILIGFAMSQQFSAHTLLIVCGLVGIISAGLLYKFGLETNRPSDSTVIKS